MPGQAVPGNAGNVAPVRVFCLLGTTAAILGLAVGLLLSDQSTAFRTCLVTTAAAGAAAPGWTAAVWLPIWRRLTATPHPTVFRLAVMAGVGGLSAVPAFGVEIIAQGPPAVLWFFVGVFCFATGLLGAGGLCLLRVGQR